MSVVAQGETLKIVTERTRLNLRLAVLGLWFIGLWQTDDIEDMLKPCFFLFVLLLHVLCVSSIFLRNFSSVFPCRNAFGFFFFFGYYLAHGLTNTWKSL